MATPMIRTSTLLAGLLAAGPLAATLPACHDPARADPPASPSGPTGSPGVSLDDVLARRRSTRAFSGRAFDAERIAHLLWAAQGISGPGGHRTAPSAGALYPLEIYAVQPSGVFHYQPGSSRSEASLSRVREGDRRAELAAAALGQDAVSHASLDIVITAVLARTRAKYGDRAERFALLEAGHVAQNVLLEATALGLGSVPVGAFGDDAVARAIGASPDESVLYVVAVGEPE